MFHPTLAAELVLLCPEGSPAMADRVVAREHVTPVGAMSHPGSQGACPAAWTRSRQAGARPSLVPRRITPRQKINNRFQDELTAALSLSEPFAEAMRLKKWCSHKQNWYLNPPLSVCTCHLKCYYTARTTPVTEQISPRSTGSKTSVVHGPYSSVPSITG